MQTVSLVFRRLHSVFDLRMVCASAEVVVQDE